MFLFTYPLAGGTPTTNSGAIYRPSPQIATEAAIVPALSVEEAVRVAIAENRRLAAVAHDKAAARAGVRSAGALVNPSFAFTPALTGGVGGGADTEVLIQQPLEVNGTRAARRGAAVAQARRTDALVLTELRTVVFAARSGYYEVARAREQAALAHTLLQNAEELDHVARRQVELGARPAIEQIQTGIEVTRARQQVALATAAVTSAEATLNAVMNRPVSAPIGTVALPSSEALAAPLPDSEECLRQALVKRTEITAGEASSEAYRQEVRLARAEGIPDIVPQWRAGSVIRGVQQSGFGIGISLPIFDYGARRGRIRQAEESARAEQARADSMRMQVQQEAVQALARVRAARDLLAAYPQGLLEEAARLLRASRIGYEEGRTTVIQLLESQRTFRQVQNDYIGAQVEYALALAELERATASFTAASLLTTSTVTATIPAIGAPRNTP